MTKLTPEERESRKARMAQMRREGLNDAQIGKEEGVTRERVRQILGNKFDIRPVGRPSSPQFNRVPSHPPRPGKKNRRKIRTFKYPFSNPALLEKLHNYIKAYQAENQKPPSLRTIGAHYKCSYTTAMYWLDRMESMGMIERIDGTIHIREKEIA